MTTRVRVGIGLAVLVGAATLATAANMRPGGDPRGDRVIWADPFDNYSQWAWDNQSNAQYQPTGTLWQGGPLPAGSMTGVLPAKSPDGSGCGVTRQSSPGADYQARQHWVGPGCPQNIVTPAGYTVTDPTTFWAQPDPGFVAGSNCRSGGWVETISMFGRIDSVWQSSASWHSPLGMFTYDLKPRLQAFQLRDWDQPSPDAVNGTDEHPLTLVFYLNDSGSVANPRANNNNTYVELNLDGDHAPTDYIWRGNRSAAYPAPECCPEGPYPIICQQAREVNSGNFEGQADLNYLNAHCPSLVPPFDPVTQTGKTWSSIAFGFLAIACKDPCTCEEQGTGPHHPTMNHPMLFDGNKWRELRAGRGRALTTCTDVNDDWGPGPDPTWGWGLAGPETRMQDAGSGQCGNFPLAGGTQIVYLKLTSDRILIEMQNANGWFCGSFERVYKGPFNGVSVGVAPGCELQDKSQGDVYICRPDGTPKQCITYSSDTADGYWRTLVDSMSLLDGILVQNTNVGACCKEDGTCQTLTQGACAAAGGIYRGAGTSCATACTGACCGPMSTCTEVNHGTCTGTYRGIGTRCSDPVGCPCPVPWADYDHDGDVDHDDFGRFQACFDPQGMAPGCQCYDRTNPKNNNVDGQDFQKFLSCAKGPNIPLTQAEVAACDAPLP